METIHTERVVQRVRHELRRREVEVTRVQPLGTEFIRVVFAGDPLEGFVSLGYDDHIKFIFPDADGGEPIRRDYTPRRYDPVRRELTIDFAIHGGGLASDWARQAAVGQRVVIGGPKGSMIVPPGYDWYLLAGDATAVPAIARRLEELPSGARAIVVVQLADTTALELANSRARIELHQVSTADELVATVDALQLPDGDGYAWCASEASATARLREILIVEKGHPRDAMRVAAYWKRGASDYHE